MVDQRDSHFAYRETAWKEEEARPIAPVDAFFVQEEAVKPSVQRAVSLSLVSSASFSKVEGCRPVYLSSVLH